MTASETRKKSVLLLVITAALWSTSGLWIKVISWSPMAILGGRSLVALVVFWVYLRKPKFRISKLQLLGAVCYVLTQITFVMATKLTTAANAIFLQYASPLYVVIFGYIFLKEKPHWVDWTAMAMIFTGLFLFFGDQLSLDGVTGNILAILSGILFAVVMIIMRSQRENNPANIIFIGNLIGMVVGFPFMFKESFTPSTVGIILFMGIFQIGLSFVLYSLAIRHVHALESNLILTLEPILNPVWVFLVLGEKPGPMALWGSLLVIAAVSFRAVMSAVTPDQSTPSPGF